MILDVQHEYKIGQDTFLHSFSPQHDFGVVFEDDQKTGYFYAIDKSENPDVLDGLHIYNVEDIIEKTLPTKIEICWREDGLLAALLVNNHCHAIFDFGNKAGYCRNGFPETPGDWALVKERQLTEEMIASVFEVKP